MDWVHMGIYLRTRAPKITQSLDCGQGVVENLEEQYEVSLIKMLLNTRKGYHTGTAETE